MSYVVPLVTKWRRFYVAQVATFNHIMPQNMWYHFTPSGATWHNIPPHCATYRNVAVKFQMKLFHCMSNLGKYWINVFWISWDKSNLYNKCLGQHWEFVPFSIQHLKRFIYMIDKVSAAFLRNLKLFVIMKMHFQSERYIDWLRSFQLIFLIELLTYSVQSTCIE